jgi:hypothetical protein
MKLFLWVLLGLAILRTAFWLITTSAGQNPLIILLSVLVFAVPPLGTFWMFYVTIRYEKRPLPLILVAFVPYAFLWYYFERVRPGKLTRPDGTATDGPT